VRLRQALSPLLAALVSGCSGGDIVLGDRNPTVYSQRGRALPIGVENVNNSAMRSADERALLRFVPDETLEIDRFYFGFKLRGASCWDPQLASNGAGDGGVVQASLVEIDPDTGLPGALIDAETVPACARHAEVEAELGATPVLAWVELSARLAGGIMYGLVVQNAHDEPDSNYFSFQMPIADSELAGPQARNELDPRAGGGIMGLDPREHVAWSADGGENYRYGSDNGEYASFVNDDTAHPATRIPQYGYRLNDGRTLAPQPYYAYKTDCSDCTLLQAAARFARSFSEVGGFTAIDGDVGTLTLTNTRTEASASCLPEPGYGFRSCRLARPIAVAPGDDYTIHASGTVELMRMDEGQRVAFPNVGDPGGELRASQLDPAPGTNALDVPSLWAGPLSAHFPTPAAN
jgi:hypothetical protein